MKRTGCLNLHPRLPAPCYHSSFQARGQARVVSSSHHIGVFIRTSLYYILPPINRTQRYIYLNFGTAADCRKIHRSGRETTGRSVRIWQSVHLQLHQPPSLHSTNTNPVYLFDSLKLSTYSYSTSLATHLRKSEPPRFAGHLRTTKLFHSVESGYRSSTLFTPTYTYNDRLQTFQREWNLHSRRGR
jgi:hypothetical protein